MYVQPNTMGMRKNAAIESFLGAMPYLSEAERNAVRSLPFEYRCFSRRSAIMPEGKPLKKLRVLCKGWAMRKVTLPDGRPQILDFVLPGDVVGLHVDRNRIATCDVTALTEVEIAEVGIDRIAQQQLTKPAISVGMYVYFLRELSILSDQVLRLGRMTAYERVCHLLLELHYRQSERGRVGYDGSVDFPITQTIVADSLGLSVVHVNRQVMKLRREGLVTLTRRSLTVHHPERLQEISGYRARVTAATGYPGLHAAE